MTMLIYPFREDNLLGNRIAMVLILDGNSEHIAHVWQNGLLWEEKTGFWLHTCAPISE